MPQEKNSVSKTDKWLTWFGIAGGYALLIVTILVSSKYALADGKDGSRKDGE